MTMESASDYQKAQVTFSQFVSFANGARAGFEYNGSCYEDEIQELAEDIRVEATNKFASYSNSEAHLMRATMALGSWVRGVLASASVLDHFPRFQLELEQWADRLNDLDPQATPPKSYAQAFYVNYTGELRNITEFKFPEVKIIDNNDNQKVILSKS